MSYCIYLACLSFWKEIVFTWGIHPKIKGDCSKRENLHQNMDKKSTMANTSQSFQKKAYQWWLQFSKIYFMYWLEVAYPRMKTTSTFLYKSYTSKCHQDLFAILTDRNQYRSQTIIIGYERLDHTLDNSVHMRDLKLNITCTVAPDHFDKDNFRVPRIHHAFCKKTIWAFTKSTNEDYFKNNTMQLPSFQQVCPRKPFLSGSVLAELWVVS